MKKIILLSVMILILMISVTTSIEKEDIIEEVVNSNESSNIIIYFPRLPDMKFVAEEIKVESSISNEEKVKLIIEILTKGSDKANLIDIMPEGTILNNVYINENTAFLDFSKEFIENHPGGSIGEYNTIYGIVNSITEINGIEQVKFLIEGKKQITYKGHTQFDVPICHDDSLIVRE